MKIKAFELERYFAKYEFSAPYLLCSSDCEAIALSELLEIADADSLKLWQDLRLGYTESQGHPVLREEVTKLYKSIGAENVVVAAPEEAVFIAMNTLLEKGDHVIAPFPGYQSLYEIAIAIGCEVDKWIPQNNDTWEFDLEKLKSLVRPETKMIVINSPHNPTGCVIKEEILQEIVDFARDKGIIVFSDEMYRLLNFDFTVSKSTCDMGDNVISLFGMSKTYSLAGIRIGWLATQNSEWISKFLEFKDYTTICSSAPSEIMAIMGLRAGSTIIENNKNLIKQNLKLAESFFDKYSDLFKWTKPQAGPIAFPELINGDDVYDFCQDIVNKAGVMLLPANIYEYSGNNFRMGFGRKNFEEGLGVLDNYLKNK